VDPEEERLAPHLVQPVEHGLVDPRRAPLLEGEDVPLRRGGARQRALVLRRQPVVVEIEALVQPVAGDQREAADGRARAVAVPLQDLGERLLGGIEHEQAVVAHAVRHRELAGQDRGVRGGGERHRAVDVLEEHALGRQAVDDRGAGAGMAVRAQVIGPRGVEGHQQDVGPGRLRAAGAATQECGGEADGRREGPGCRVSGEGGQARILVTRTASRQTA
jgi:hypothetical protein